MAVPLCTLTAFALLLAGLAQHIHSHFPNETPFEAVESWLTVPSFPDHYKTLGVSRDMPFERLKAAYDEKKNKFPAHEWAFAVLSNTRAEYDEMLNNDEKTRPDRQQMRYTVTAGFSAAAVVIFYVLGSVESSWLETRRSVREAQSVRQRIGTKIDSHGQSLRGQHPERHPPDTLPHRLAMALLNTLELYSNPWSPRCLRSWSGSSIEGASAPF